MLLNQLLECKTPEDLINVGVALTRPQTLTHLQRELMSCRMVFSQEEYWQEDSLSTHTVDELLHMAQGEEGSMQVLHLFQVLQKACPALTSVVERLLQRTTR